MKTTTLLITATAAAALWAGTGTAQANPAWYYQPVNCAPPVVWTAPLVYYTVPVVYCETVPVYRPAPAAYSPVCSEQRVEVRETTIVRTRTLRR